jgi:hypothetical protein
VERPWRPGEWRIEGVIDLASGIASEDVIFEGRCPSQMHGTCTEPARNLQGVRRWSNPEREKGWEELVWGESDGRVG